MICFKIESENDETKIRYHYKQHSDYYAKQFEEPEPILLDSSKKTHEIFSIEDSDKRKSILLSWYKQRLIDIEKSTGLVINALQMADIAILYGFDEFKPLHETLIYFDFTVMYCDEVKIII